jgi:hypothetical protein
MQVFLAPCFALACANVVDGASDEATGGFAGSSFVGSGGGTGTGGSAAGGGAATGGAASSSGGSASASGGASTGGTASGGSSNTGGAASGGSATGGSSSGGTGGGMVGTCTPDVGSLSQGRCGLTVVFQSKLYECISQTAGVAGEPTGCGTAGVYCSAIEPTNGAWGATAWQYVQDCE